MTHVSRGFSFEDVDLTSRKKFGYKPGTKELLWKFFVIFVECLQQIQRFLHKPLFEEKRILMFHSIFLRLLDVHKAKKK